MFVTVKNEFSHVTNVLTFGTSRELIKVQRLQCVNSVRTFLQTTSLRNVSNVSLLTFTESWKNECMCNIHSLLVSPRLLNQV